MRHNVEFVAGAYRMKVDKEIYPVHWPQQKRLFVDEETKLPLLEADLVPGGFWRLSRSGVEALAASLPDDRWIANDVAYPGLRYPWLFEFAFDGRVRRSEDFTFCRKWQDLGGKIFVDPVINLDHTGPKTFPGNLVAALGREVEAHLAGTDLATRVRLMVEDAA